MSQLPTIKGDTELKPKDDYMDLEKFETIKMSPLPYLLDELEPHVPKELLDALYSAYHMEFVL